MSRVNSSEECGLRLLVKETHQGLLHVADQAKHTAAQILHFLTFISRPLLLPTSDHRFVSSIGLGTLVGPKPRMKSYTIIQHIIMTCLGR